jgi:predicted phosphoribosyltransferase
MPENKYFIKRCREALKGDRESAVDLLYHIEESLSHTKPPSPAAIIYLRIAIKRILDGVAPGKAFGLAGKPHRSKGAQEIDYLILAVAYQRCLNQGKMPSDAKNEVASKYGPAPRTIERAYAEFGDLSYLSDKEIEAILDDKK